MLPFDLLMYCLSAVVVVWGLIQLWKAVFTHSIVINKGTDHDERMTVSTNFTIFTSKEKALEKTNAMFEIGEARLKFVNDRFQKIIREENERKLKEQNVAKIG